MAVPSGVLGIVMHTMIGNLPGTDGLFRNPAAQVSAASASPRTEPSFKWVSIPGGIACHCSNGNAHRAQGTRRSGHLAGAIVMPGQGARAAIT